jgi:hypothetical protein
LLSGVRLPVVFVAAMMSPSAFDTVGSSVASWPFAAASCNRLTWRTAPPTL